MTKHTNFPTPGTESENVVTFPNNSDAPCSEEHPARDDHMPDGMPDGFLLRDDGIYHLRPGDGEELEPVKICSPLIVKGLCRRLGGTGWGSVVKVQDPDGGWHELILEGRDISGTPARVVAPLVDHGLMVTNAAKAAQSVKELLNAWQPVARYDRVNHLGWVDGEFSAFTLGDGRVIGNALVVPDHGADHVAAAMHAKGTLEEWRATVAAPCSGNSLMIFALSLAFSGPLLSVLGREGGGFHLRGDTSKGKSTLQRLAASVWGAPEFMQDWRTTDNGIESVAAACNDSFLVLDELYQVEPRVVGNIVYMLANGVGKTRFGPNSKMQEVKRWTVQVLSSGELSLEEHMTSGGRKPHMGQEIRMVDLVADARRHGAFDDLHDAPGIREFAEGMKRATESNYGLAGPAFVEHLIGKTDKTDNFEGFIDKFCETCISGVDAPSDGLVLRVLGRFASVALAGEVATTCGLTGWKRGEALEAAHELFAAWFEDREVTTKEEIAEAVERTRVYVSQNLDHFLKLGTSGGEALDGWRDASWIYIRSERWQQIHADADPVAAARIHKTAGLLRTQGGNGLQFKMGRDVPGRPKTYAVRSAELLSIAES